MKKIPLLLAAVAFAASFAHAQVKLVYQAAEGDYLVTGVQGSQPVFEKDGQRLPVPADGRIVVQPAERFAPLQADLEVGYRPMGRMVAYWLNLVGESEDYLPGNLYYACIWQVDGEAVHTSVQSYPPGRRTQIRGDGTFALNAGEERGFLRCYLFADGFSISGVTTRAARSKEARTNLVALKAAVDAGDRKAVLAWAKAFPKQEIPLPLLTLVAEWGDMDAFNAIFGNPPAVKRLKDPDWTDLLETVMKAGRLPVVEALLARGIKLDQPGKDQFLPLQLAINLDSPELVGRLLAAGVKVNGHTAENDDTPLALAIKSGSSGAVEALLAYGAKWPSSKKELTEWLVLSMKAGSLPNVERLLAQGANPNFKQEGYEKHVSPLIVEAAQTNRVDFLAALLRAGADVNAQNTEGLTALMVAAYNGDRMAVELCLKSGAKLTLTDKSTHRTAAAWALGGGNPGIAARLRKSYQPDAADLSRQLHTALLVGDRETIGQLKAGGARLNAKSDDIYDIVVEAIRAGDRETVLEAVAAKIDLGRKQWGDWTLAAVARRYERPELAELLRESGTDTPPPVKKLPIQLIRSPRFSMPEEILEEQPEAKAEVDVFIDPAGQPVLPVLRSCSDPRLARYVMENAANWGFNPLEKNEKSWRRVVVPVIISAKNIVGRNGGIFDERDLDTPPVVDGPVPASWAFLKTGPVQVAWMKFLVNREGEAVAPSLMASSSPATATAALELAGRWTFRPGIKRDNLVWSRVERIVVLPQGRPIAPGVIYALDDLPAGWVLPQLIQRGRDMDINLVREEKLGADATVVLLAYTIGADGKARDVKILASTNRAAAKRAKFICEGSTFAPAKKAGHPADLTVIQCVTDGYLPK